MEKPSALKKGQLVGQGKQAVDVQLAGFGDAGFHNQPTASLPARMGGHSQRAHFGHVLPNDGQGPAADGGPVALHDEEVAQVTVQIGQGTRQQQAVGGTRHQKGVDGPDIAHAGLANAQVHRLPPLRG